jgi:hypothetical protein
MVFTQPSLWGLQSLYDALKRDPRFQPTVIVMPNTEGPIDTWPQSFEDNWEFFVSRCPSPIAGWSEKDGFRSPRRIWRKPAILFIEQPSLHLTSKWSLREISKRNLVAYVPYGFKVASVESDHFNLPLHNAAWRVYAETQWHKEKFAEWGKRGGKNVVVSGYVKFDQYLGLLDEKVRNRATDTPTTIIWAPHWSVRDNYLGYSSFEQFHQLFVDMSVQYPGITWVFKPHPRLRFQLVHSRLFTEQQVDAYYSWWNLQHNTSLYESGDYFKLFAESAALITDSGSFLAEYLPTQKPVLVLESESSVGYNEMGQKIVETYYHAKTAQEVRRFISENIELRIDPKRRDRERIARELGLAHLPAAAITILEDILHEFNQ